MWNAQRVSKSQHLHCGAFARYCCANGGGAMFRGFFLLSTGLGRLNVSYTSTSQCRTAPTATRTFSLSYTRVG